MRTWNKPASLVCNMCMYIILLLYMCMYILLYMSMYTYYTCGPIQETCIYTVYMYNIQDAHVHVYTCMYVYKVVWFNALQNAYTYLVLWLTLVFLISLNSTSQRRKTVWEASPHIHWWRHSSMYMYLSPGLPRHTSCSWAYCCRTVISMPLRMPDFLKQHTRNTRTNTSTVIEREA